MFLYLDMAIMKHIIIKSYILDEPVDRQLLLLFLLFWSSHQQCERSQAVDF